MKTFIVCVALLFLVQSMASWASDAPISFYDPTTRQNRPMWWIQETSPSLFYSTAHLEQISNTPLFIKTNEDRLGGIQKVMNQQKDARHSLAATRRLQGLNLIEKGEEAILLGEQESNEPSSGVVGMVGQRFTWSSDRGTVNKYRQPIGLVGFLANAFSESKDERHRVRSTYYLSEAQKKVSEEER